MAAKKTAKKVARAVGQFAKSVLGRAKRAAKPAAKQAKKLGRPPKKIAAKKPAAKAKKPAAKRLAPGVKPRNKPTSVKPGQRYADQEERAGGPRELVVERIVSEPSPPLATGHLRADRRYGECRVIQNGQDQPRRVKVRVEQLANPEMYTLVDGEPRADGESRAAATKSGSEEE